MPIELIPMLVIGSTYQNKKRFPTKDLKKYSFTVSGHHNIHQDKFGINWFVFYDGRDNSIWIRQLELARALFLQNSPITRTAFRPGGLNGLATTEFINGTTHIKFNDLSDYPLSNLKSKCSRAHISWLLLDENARKSFNSILKFWMEETTNYWAFEFTPPNLKDWTITGLGELIQSGSIIVIEELLRLNNPVFSYPGKIEIFHPRSRNPVSIDPHGGQPPEIDPVDKEPEINLGKLPRLGKKLDKISDPVFSFTFENNINTELNIEKSIPKITPRFNDKNDPIKEETGVGHADKNGSALELDYGINRTNENEHHATELSQGEPTAKFQIFKEAAEELIRKKHFQVIQINCYEFPVPKKGNLRALRTQNQKPLLFYLAAFHYRNLPFAIIEVDTETLLKKHTLSTLIIGMSSDATESIQKIMQSCSDMGVRWDHISIKDVCHVIRTCNHPYKQRQIGNKLHVRTPAEYRKAWVELLEQKVIDAFDEYRNLIL